MTGPRLTPAAIGVKIFEKYASDIVLAKEQLKKTEKNAQIDIAAMHTELEMKQTRVHKLEEQIVNAEDMFRQMMIECRTKTDDLTESLKNEANQARGMEALDAKHKETIARMNKLKDDFEKQTHELRELDQECERLKVESASWKQKYDDKHEEWKRLYEVYNELYEKHDQCP